jgi:membrane glycosyltransferase
MPRPSNAGLLAGALVEMAASILIAPILMLTQSQAVIEVLAGTDSGWSTQRRDGDAPELAAVLRFHLWHQLAGVAFAVACALAGIHVLLWMSPIILGLLAAPLISIATSRTASGWLADVLATPEDLQRPGIVAAAEDAHPGWTALLARHPPRQPQS